tara:strand:- start:409 stop:1536 length:1128 start_codon:yes stop_codon:yes gene_type:complete
MEDISLSKDSSGNSSICFLNYDLAFGGTEKVIVSLANHFQSLGKKVTILTLSDANDFNDFLHPDVAIECLQITKMKLLVPKLSQFILKNKFDNFISNVWPLTSLSFIVRIFSQDTRLIFIEHCNLSEQFKSRSLFFRFVQKISIVIFYRFAHVIVGVSDGVKQDLVSKGLREHDIKVIYNPVITQPIGSLDQSNQATKLWKSSDKKKLIAVGRLKAQKNFINLIDAIYFAKKNLGLDVSLLILGDGEERNKIFSRIIELGLEGNIFLGGWVSDPLPYYDLSDLFILPSDYEGFGVVIVEAMSRGLNIVSTDCKSGPSEILQQGELGFLCHVNDPEALGYAIKNALDSPIKKELLIKRSEDFSEKIIGALYEDIIV